MSVVRVSASKDVDIFIGRGELSVLGERICGIIRGRSALVVTDDIVDRLYGDTVCTALKCAGFRVLRYVIRNGEGSKTADTFIAILNYLAENGFTRTDVIVALGGGVVGDVAGFAASAYMRGTGLVQIPTTLLAAVDSSVGGKTAINLSAGKNLAGAFYQPDLVICDTAIFDTLPNEVFACGVAEIIKYGVLSGKELFALLESSVEDNLEEIITRCVRIKSEIVNADEREGGVRKLLNLGHTVGHAIELCSGYTVPHGSAVAAGLCVIVRASCKHGFINESDTNRICRLIARNNLPVTTEFSAHELLRAALSDKKRSGGSITLVIPEQIGRCVLRDFELCELESFIALGLTEES